MEIKYLAFFLICNDFCDILPWYLEKHKIFLWPTFAFISLIIKHLGLNIFELLVVKISEIHLICFQLRKMTL